MPLFTAHAERMTLEGTNHSMNLHNMLVAAGGANTNMARMIRENYLHNEESRVVEDFRKLFECIINIRLENKKNNITYLRGSGNMLIEGK